MGKSRSAAVCIAFLLNCKLAESPQSALELIQQSRALCEPNDGFMKQLTLYHEMGCPDNVIQNPVYQRWLYQRGVDESVACGRGPEADIVRFEDEQLDINGLEQVSEIKCRKCRYFSPHFIFVIRLLRSTYFILILVLCHSVLVEDINHLNAFRRILATTPFIIPHEQKPNRKPIPSPSAQCAHIFLHPLTWMRQSLYPSTDAQAASSSHDHSLSEEAPLSGRLTCPNTNCGCNIGKFAWQGMQCSCGVWVTPAIGVLRAKVDVVDASVRNDTAKATGIGIRLPPGMRNVEQPSTGRENL